MDTLCARRREKPRGRKNLLFVNKKKQKNFIRWPEAGCGRFVPRRAGGAFFAFQKGMAFCYNAAMSDEPAPLVSAFLRRRFARMHVRFDRIEADLADIKMSMSGQESATGRQLAKLRRLSETIAQTNAYFDRIERRLDPMDEPG